jgi:hypothetical protein
MATSLFIVNILIRNMNIQKLKKDRFSFLLQAYEMARGSNRIVINGWDVGGILNFEEEYTSNIFNYLAEEELIEGMGAGLGLLITHAGVKEVEEALSEPNKPTEHFSPINQYNINIGNMSGGAIQQATNNSTINYTNSIDTLNAIKDFTSDLKQFISNSNLTGQQVEELEIDIQTIEIQANAQKPKTDILKSSLNSVKTIIEGMVAGVAATYITSNPELIIQKATNLINLLGQ